jgi:hypothetical protein
LPEVNRGSQRANVLSRRVNTVDGMAWACLFSVILAPNNLYGIIYDDMVLYKVTVTAVIYKENLDVCMNFYTLSAYKDGGVPIISSFYCVFQVARFFRGRAILRAFQMSPNVCLCEFLHIYAFLC